MLAEVVRHLRCPVCGSALAAVPGALHCSAGHAFDVARQGYANLLTGRAPAGADTPEMVAARAALLDAGHLDPVVDAVAEAAAEAAAGHAGAPGLIVDAGAGTGRYLAAALDRLPDHHGLAVDVAKAAARVAARCHPRAAALVGDVWRGLPVADGAAAVILDVFAPRNGAEFARVLRPDGALLVVTPRPEHLGELVAALGLLSVDPEKEERLAATLGPRFRLARRRTYAYERSLEPVEVASVVAMGPSAWHADRGRIAALDAPIRTTFAVTLHTYLPSRPPPRRPSRPPPRPPPRRS